MKPTRDQISEEYRRAVQAMRAFQAEPDTLKLDGAGTRKVEAWFLGPKAENADEFERLVVEAVRDQTYWRRNYHPEDPTHITETVKQSSDYRAALGQLRDEYLRLLAFLKKSVPFFSMRYQGQLRCFTTRTT
jgi:hypothetical protein